MQEGHRQFVRRFQVCLKLQLVHFHHLILSSNKSKSFYSIDLILLSVIKQNILPMYVKFFSHINKTLEIIQL